MKEKTIEQLLKEKASLEAAIKSEVDIFLRDNPAISSINFDTQITVIEHKCGYLKDFSLYIKIEL